MMLLIKPEIKLDKHKLHISRKPGPFSWFLLGLSAIICFEICKQLTDNSLFVIALVLGEITFGLDILGEWEDIILDKETNKAIFSKCVWSDKFYWQENSKSSIIIKLGDIRHVGVSFKLGLFIICKDGKTVLINMHGLVREEMQKLRKTINYFLNMSRMKYFDQLPSDPSERLSVVLDSEDEYWQSLSRKHYSISGPQNSSTFNHNPVNQLQHPIQQNLSSPLLSGTQNNNSKQKHARSLYTKNCFTFNDYKSPVSTHSEECDLNLRNR